MTRCSSRDNRAQLRRQGIKATIAQPDDQRANRKRRGRAGGRLPAFGKDQYRRHTAIAFRQRAHAFFTAHGITVERVLTDNGSCCKAKRFTQTLAAAGIAHKRIRPYRPQTNGKGRTLQPHPAR